ncbi:hypothetical protein KP79_PYT11043 [Mizuhopecten yessoensis]|uniref:Uncharacterized protein n=1 Tax=Mizuhopecten yessoensis TaxID=6573 RepID=A0A210PZV6_MIZYE|nr:hypothetical protein KP79_PYT11043 [Mizuhopecten yessoensis]
MADKVVSARVHIFKKGNDVALDNYYIYVTHRIDSEFSDDLRELKKEHRFGERCLKRGVQKFEMELSVFERDVKRMVVVENHQAWTYASNLITAGKADLHIKLFDAELVGSPNCLVLTHCKTEGETPNTEPPANEPPAKIRKRTSHTKHKPETRAKLDLYQKVKDARKSKEDVNRTDTEIKLMEQFVTDINDLDDCVAIDELTIRCGICHRDVALNKVIIRMQPTLDKYTVRKDVVEKSAVEEEEEKIDDKPGCRENVDAYPCTATTQHFGHDIVACHLPIGILPCLPFSVASPELPVSSCSLPDTSRPSLFEQTDIEIMDTEQKQTHLPSEADIETVCRTYLVHDMNVEDTDSDSCSDYESVEHNLQTQHSPLLPKQMYDPMFDSGYQR